MDSKSARAASRWRLWKNRPASRLKRSRGTPFSSITPSGYARWMRYTLASALASDSSSMPTSSAV
jgi:hypothetical protein